MKRFPPQALVFSLVIAFIVMIPSAANGQKLGQLLSPGPLSQAHAKFEGLDNCEKCHEPGKGVSDAKCLSCHPKITERIKAKMGVHREVEGDCAICHAEHVGRDGDIRPLDVSGFDHLTETGFALDGQHAALASDCSKCHKTRSFLELKPECSSCHKDSHNGTLGADCAACHTTMVLFKDSGMAFDHSKADFPLVGAHQTVACASCHKNRQFKGLTFGQCSDCHSDPHEGQLGADCASCHTPTAWASTNLDHARTGFALEGAHASILCIACHKEPATKVTLAHENCSDCHRDPHLGVFTEDCAGCHTTGSFKGGKFDHGAKTEFPLADRHAQIPCIACHKQAGTAAAVTTAGPTMDFRGLKSECAACHDDAHKGQLGPDCASCHVTRGFRVDSFQHPKHPEFFVGSHTGLECEKCHKNGVEAPTPESMVSSRVYRGLSTECVTCHGDVHLGQLGALCADCHSIAADDFKQVFFNHDRSEFKLTGKHATIECVACHKPSTDDFPAGHGSAVRFSNMPSDCAGCHQDVHFGQLGDRCADCHTPDSFKVETFDHREELDFFTAGHAGVQCRQCHPVIEADWPAGHGEAVRFDGLDRQCSTCHNDVHEGTLGADCASCHSVHAPFEDPSRAFHKSTVLPLEGRHLQVPCASCHWNEQIKGTPTNCADCHWFRRQDDRFRTQLGIQCESCHTPVSWTAVTWDHGSATGHDLVGTHATLDCVACHTDGRFDGAVSTDCASCHLEEYLETEDPDHQEVGFPTTCEDCHSPGDTSWHQARFNHASYPLVGSHAAQDCQACHASGIYQGLPSDCVDCHFEDYQQTQDPDHADAAFPTDCVQCHNAADPSWGDGEFGHDIYPLVGSHAAQDCQACHDSGVYQGLPSDCVDCHLEDYQQTEDPDHADAGFPTDCVQCHNAADPSWGDGEFGHDIYPLVGSHAAQDCQACHDSGVYQGLPSDCVDCHLEDYQQTEDPDHADAGFPTDCVQCHNAADPSWGDGEFGHDIYPLQGSHAAQPCQACHDGGVYQGLPSDCVDCHLEDYQQTEDPDHADAGFPTDCEQCHSAADPSWGDGEFGHDIYPLQGSHAAQPCQACHDGGVYQGLPSDCVDCHLEDYQQTEDPDHADAGFPTDCEQCHSAADPSWGDGEFGHDIYPLQGSHAAQPCQACHDGGVYQGLPSDCVDCHLEDYQQTEDPDHADAGFPTDCEQCHSAADNDWGDGEFGHDIYPLQGSHAAQPCQACHDGGVYQGLPSDCVDCHLEDYQQTEDPDHADAGFPTDCEQCHSAADNDWGDGEFGHDIYPLQGSHAAQPCQACHDGGVYQGLPSDCVDCHLDDYQQTSDPNHSSAGFPTDCELCHNAADTDWDQGDFDHFWFPINGGNHGGFECSDCHTNPTNFAIFTCTNPACHPRSDADEDHDEVEGYVYDSPACYSCHPDGEEIFGRSGRRIRPPEVR